MTFSLSRLLRPAGLEETIAVATFAAALLALAMSGAFAHEVKVGDLTLQHPWARATPPGAKVGGGFTVIVNGGTEADRLVGGTVPFAERLEVHEMAMENDVMKMRQLTEGLEIPAGATVELKPGSYHVMFMGLKQDLKEGERLTGTLVFEKAGPVEVEWAVEGMAGKPAGNGDGMQHGEGHGMQHGKDMHTN